MTGPLGPQISGIPYLAKVHQAVHRGSWKLPRSRNPIITLLRACLPANVPTGLSEGDGLDSYLWRNSLTEPPAYFSSSKTWKSLNPISTSHVPWHKAVWFSQRIPKHAFVFWLLLRGRMTTRDRLQRWGMLVPSACLLCSIHSESAEHLFFNCSFSIEVWRSFFNHQAFIPPLRFEDAVTWIENLSRPSKVKVICKLILQAVTYYLWKERNSRLHSNLFKDTAAITKEIQLTIRGKLASLDRLIPPNQSALQPQVDADSYLVTWFRFFQR